MSFNENLVFIQLMFNDSNLLQTNPIFQSIILWPDYPIYKLNTNVDFTFCDFTSIYDINLQILNIKVYYVGPYSHWTYKINNNDSVLVNNNNNDINVNIGLNDSYNINICFYNNSYKKIGQKALTMNHITNLEDNIYSQHGNYNVFTISVINNVFFVNNTQQHTLTLYKNNTYIFDQNNTSNNFSPLGFYLSNNNISNAELYNINVKYYINNSEISRKYYINNIANSYNKYITITIANNIIINTLYYLNQFIPNTGGIINII